MKKLTSIILCMSIFFALSTISYASDVKSNNDKNMKILSIYQSAGEIESETIENIDSITLNGVTYGKEYGLKKHTIISIIPATPDIRMNDWNPHHSYEWTKGTSYVKSTEQGYLYYKGEARAMGNVFQGERVVQATVTYLRNNVVLKTGSSSAAFKSNRWEPGPKTIIYVLDSLDLYAPPTVVEYNFITMDPHYT